MKIESSHIHIRGFYKKKKIAIIASFFNSDICELLVQGSIDMLKSVGYTDDDFVIFRVPGAFEIPLMAQSCLKSGRFFGVVSLGCVIRGETPHFDYVCKAVTEGLTRVALDHGYPVGFGLLTTENREQALARSQPGQPTNKGWETAATVLEMIELLF